ncbi:MAG: lipoprotein-releasing ABC transporter permease subunit [Thiotrichaceae bacterium]|nr:lipoprotein-releasing ABC transporter permease subunit [Thiotrichaceae bacterium]PCI14309.1 MAG: lipoprotein-releasing system transmembrane subunit LolC [Thiotrichales bacterium]
MFRPLEIFIGLRYTRAKRRNHFISFISLISMLGIALGVTVLITVISVMNGFEKELRERILGVVSHATVQAVGKPLQEWQQVGDLVRQYEGVTGIAPFIHAEGMLSQGAIVSGTLIRGILPSQEGEVSQLGDKMLAGTLDNLQAGEFGIILGKDLALSMRAGMGDRVTLITPQASVTAVGVLPRLKRFTVVGVFEIGMYEYDSALALLHIEDASRLFRLDGGVTGVRIKMDDMFAAPKLTRQLLNELPIGYSASDWTRQHANFFRAVQMEKTVMFVILFLIVAVAAFNIVSTLVMMVTDKESDIAILRTLGASPGSIMGIFIVQGALIGVIGTLLGTIGGVVLALNVETLVPAIEKLFSIQFLAAEVYYISDLPSDMRIADVIQISSVALTISFIATLYPAWRASRTQPAEALRYE